MTNEQWMRTFSERIGLPVELKNALFNYYQNHRELTDAVYEKYKDKHDFSRFIKDYSKAIGSDAYLLALSFAVLRAKDTLTEYHRRGISEEVFDKTMEDITLWCDNCKKKTGFFGLENLGWIKNHLSPNIFRLGRLQFQIYHMYYPVYTSFPAKWKTHIRRGTPIINVHIPQGEKLTAEACEDSFCQARAFFRERDYACFACESWLLFPGNREFMSESSNIIQFAERFDIVAQAKLDHQAIERVFGERQSDINDYPEDTTLQRNAKAYMKSGGKLGTAFGIIKNN